MVVDDDRLKVERVDLDGTDLITVIGEIDIATVPSLDSVMAGLTGQDLVVDLQGVTFMDSTGLHSLLRAKSRVETRGGEMRLVLGQPGHIRRLMHAAGVLDRFIIDEGEQPEEPGGWIARLTRKRPRRPRQGKPRRQR